jgi:type II secretory pathway pseudopilin PulG
MRPAFTLRDLLVAVAVIAVLLGLLLPSLMRARESARQSSCRGQIGQLARAITIYSEAYTSFPALGDDNTLTAVAGSTASDQTRASYSWRVAILPYLEEGQLYDAIQRTSKGFVLPPPSPSVTSPDGQHFLQSANYLLRCPSFAGRATSDVSVEGALISNYHAISATRLQYLSAPTEADGVIIPGGGVRPDDVNDGLSATVLLCESKEPRFAVWGEAVTNWVVALEPQQTASNQKLDWAEMRTALRLGAQEVRHTVSTGATLGGRRRPMVGAKQRPSRGRCNARLC